MTVTDVLWAAVLAAPDLAERERRSAAYIDYTLRRYLMRTYCRVCGLVDRHWPGCRYSLAPCGDCRGEGVVERSATPAEVDAGCELGYAYDPCSACRVRLPELCTDERPTKLK